MTSLEPKMPKFSNSPPPVHLPVALHRAQIPGAQAASARCQRPVRGDLRGGALLKHQTPGPILGEKILGETETNRFITGVV